jgi:hypothetical protein
VLLRPRVRGQARRHRRPVGGPAQARARALARTPL